MSGDTAGLGTVPQPGPAPATQTEAPAPETCGAVKHGSVDLTCTLPRDHDKPQDEQPGTWHESRYTERREVNYPGARHVITLEEFVTWEPVDHIAEATRHIMASRRRVT